MFFSFLLYKNRLTCHETVRPVLLAEKADSFAELTIHGAAALAGRLPRLVRLEDLRGDLHAHTKAADGKNTLHEMALAARRRGFSYLAITDHSHRLTVARGLDSDALARQGDEIDRLNLELRGLKLLKGGEVDIDEDGGLDLP